MWDRYKISLVFPAYNEQENIAQSIKDFQALRVVDEILVVNNNCTDDTVSRAVAAGAGEGKVAGEDAGRDAGRRSRTVCDDGAAEALARFQRQEGLAATGVLDGPTVLRLAQRLDALRLHV